MDPLDPIDHWTQSVGLARLSHRIASIGLSAQVAALTSVGTWPPDFVERLNPVDLPDPQHSPDPVDSLDPVE